jgi:putative transposase
MRKSSFTAAQRQSIISEQSGGKSIEEICRTHQISAATFHKWKEAQKTEADENKRRIDQLGEREQAAQEVVHGFVAGSRHTKGGV